MEVTEIKKIFIQAPHFVAAFDDHAIIGLVRIHERVTTLLEIERIPDSHGKAMAEKALSAADRVLAAVQAIQKRCLNFV